MRSRILLTPHTFCYKCMNLSQVIGRYAQYGQSNLRQRAYTSIGRAGISSSRRASNENKAACSGIWHKEVPPAQGESMYWMMTGFGTG